MNLKPKNNCSLFITAGFPKLNSALEIIPELEKEGVDLIELGIPFSDPLADGPVIQESSAVALKNGMQMDLIFDQLETIKKSSTIPIVLMGYFNPIFKYGLEKFLINCKAQSVDGAIIPDLTIEVYERHYSALFERYEVPVIFLITPETPERRIRKIEAHSKAFIYLVSSSSITGKREDFSHEQIKGFQRIANLKLSVPVLVGFGIHNSSTFNTVCEYFEGAIVGSAFIKSIKNEVPARHFLKELMGNQSSKILTP